MIIADARPFGYKKMIVLVKAKIRTFTFNAHETLNIDSLPTTDLLSSLFL